MEGNKKRPRAILIFGAPCSGKTIFAENFANKYSLPFYDFAAIKTQNKFTHRQIMTIVELLTRTRHDLIIEGGIDTEKARNEMRAHLARAGYEPVLVWVQTDATTIRSRLKSKYRDITKAKDVYNTAINTLEAPSEAEHAIILSGKHTFATQAKHVISGLAKLETNDHRR